eukprot:gene29535-35649_t
MHGIFGTSKDLSYLAKKLELGGFIVLKSKSNEFHRSLAGVQTAARNLRNEIAEAKTAHKGLTKISFVGNSLGGIFARAVLKDIFNEGDKTCLGLYPTLFMTIATPHLGVRYYTFLDERGIHVPLILKTITANVLQASGKELFGTDSMVLNESLIYQLALQESYLEPLRAFRRRRLYANVDLDFVVPLGTAALMDDGRVSSIRRMYSGKYGIVDTISDAFEEDMKYGSIGGGGRRRSWHGAAEERHMSAMRRSLNSVGWEKVLVHFPGTLPNAHNKICALNKYGSVVDKLLGYPEGEFVMDHAAAWFAEHR